MCASTEASVRVALKVDYLSSKTFGQSHYRGVRFLVMWVGVLTIAVKRTPVSAFQNSPLFDASSRIARQHHSAITHLFSTTSGGRVSTATVDEHLVEKTSGKASQNAPVQEKLDTNPPKGTRDFYPEDMRLRNWLFGHWRRVARLYGFSEYDAPVLESEALYVRKAGEEVTQQLYNFEDKGGRRVALRPEMTPSLARMVMAKKTPGVIKWFSVPQCWRYERMTRGRRREHFQWNVDVWGVSSVKAEAELLACMVRFFTEVGLTSEDVGIKLNSRAVIGELLTELGVPEDKFAATCVLVDKLEKVPIESIQDDLTALGLSSETISRLTDTILSENCTVKSLEAVLSEGSTALASLNQLFELCDTYGISDWLVFDASVVRGLAYYTGAVFEAFDRRGKLRAIAGGGRYDKLLESFGAATPTPAAGFGFGDAVIVELLKDRNLLPDFSASGDVDAVVYSFDDDSKDTPVVAEGLRSIGLKTDVVLEDDRKVKWVFKHANRIGASYVVLIGGSGKSSEEDTMVVSIKDMITGTQVDDLPLDGMMDWFRQQQQNIDE